MTAQDTDTLETLRTLVTLMHEGRVLRMEALGLTVELHPSAFDAPPPAAVSQPPPARAEESAGLDDLFYSVER